MTERTSQGNYAFIDSQNLNLGTQTQRWKMDWSKFRQFLQEKYNVEKAYMFIGYVPEFEEMYEQLHKWGYLIVLKPTFDMTRVRPEEKKDDKNGTSKEQDRPVKGNIDADLVLWAMKEMPRYNQALIVSGDGDFYALIEYLVEQKKLAKILTPNGQYSHLFNAYEDFITRLDTYKKQLSYGVNHRQKGNRVHERKNRRN